ncbi:MAG: hydrogenase maturation protease [Candidatus Kariarchaeaceae archaeon]
MEHYNIHLLGCGNILKGDDGFGPSVIKHLEMHYLIPDNIFIEDAGLACADWLLNLVGDDEGPKQIVVVDALDLGLEVGQIKLVKAHEMNLPDSSISRHLFPDKNVVNMLYEAGVELTFVSCQVAYIPEDLLEGLSEEITKKVPVAAEIVANLLSIEKKPSV